MITKNLVKQSALPRRDVASEMKLLLDAAGRLAPSLPEQQRAELDLAR